MRIKGGLLMRKWMAGLVTFSLLFGNASVSFAEYDDQPILTEFHINQYNSFNQYIEPSDDSDLSQYEYQIEGSESLELDPDADPEFYPEYETEDTEYTEEETESETPEDINAREEATYASEIISKIIKPGMTEYQKALTIHDYINSNRSTIISVNFSCSIWINERPSACVLIRNNCFFANPF